MRDSLLHRGWHDLEVRARERIIRGIAVPFDEPAPVMDDDLVPYTEVFRRGAFARTLSRTRALTRIPYYRDHDPDRQIGVPIVLREDAAGLFGEWKVAAFDLGDQVLALAEIGALGHSVGVIPRRHRGNKPGLVERLEVILDHVAITNRPAYLGAEVLEVRSEQNETHLREPHVRRQEALTLLDAMRRRVPHRARTLQID